MHLPAGSIACHTLAPHLWPKVVHLGVGGKKDLIHPLAGREFPEV